MTAHTRTRQIGATGYYLGRPAAFWQAVLAPRPAARQSPRAPGAPAQQPPLDGRRTPAPSG